MKKSTLIFVVLVLSILGIIAFSKNKKISNPSVKIQDKVQNQNETQKIEKSSTSSTTQSAESVGEDEINLNVNSPANGITISQPSITVEGTTIPKAFVFVNDLEIRADSFGNFSTTVDLDEGENTIVIVASDEKGNNSEKELIVTYESNVQQ